MRGDKCDLYKGLIDVTHSPGEGGETLPLLEYINEVSLPHLNLIRRLMASSYSTWLL